MTDLVERLRAYEGRNWETTACYNGMRDETATALEAKDKEIEALRLEFTVLCEEFDVRNAENTELQVRAETAERRVTELEAQVYVPGSWHCAKCKFTLLQSNLNARDGTLHCRPAPN